MSKKNLIIGAALLIFLGLIGWFNWFYVSGTWRYKMTVVVETPEGIKTGYAVREIANSQIKPDLNFPHVRSYGRAHGEAVVVDMGPRGKLFALLSNRRQGIDHYKYIFYKYFNSKINFDGIVALNKMPLGAKAILQPRDYPSLVAFKDLNDPNSIVLVYDESDVEDGTINTIEENFGVGVRLKEISVELVDDPVTHAMSKVLGKRQTVGPYYFVQGEE